MSNNILWTDERIDAQIEDFDMGENARNFARHIRDDYEAQLAQTWQPLPDGEYDMGVENEPLYVFGNTDPDVCTHVEWQGETVMLDLGMTVCRLVERAEVQPYSHRNGETEPPTVGGWYWFRGNVTSSYRGEVPYSGSVTILESTYENRGLCVISTDESPSSNIEKWTGQWYGPIVPPWEVDHE